MNARGNFAFRASFLITLAGCGHAASIRLDHLVDLTHTLSGRFPVVPVPGLTFPFEQKPIATIANNGVFAEQWHMIAHNGTHMDAPIHYVEGGHAMAGYDVRELIVPAVVIDIRKQAANDPDAQLSVADILVWEKQHGRIQSHVAVLMNSGWGDKVDKDPKGFVGIDGSGRTHFPTFSAAAVEFLIRQRDIVGIGVDTLSFDQVGPGVDAPAHKRLFRANKWGVECIANLDKVPTTGATIFVGGLKVEGASASPIRLIAAW